MSILSPEILGVVAIMAGILIALLIPYIFFMLSLQNTLKLVQPQNRRMSPGEVWLMLIPLFGTVWTFFVVNRVAESIRKELNDEQFSFEQGAYNDPFRDMGELPTRNIGLAHAICFACSWIPIIGSFLALGGFVCWIMYWVEVVKYKRQLEARRWTKNVAGEHPASAVL